MSASSSSSSSSSGVSSLSVSQDNEEAKHSYPQMSSSLESCYPTNHSMIPPQVSVTADSGIGETTVDNPFAVRQDLRHLNPNTVGVNVSSSDLIPTSRLTIPSSNNFNSTSGRIDQDFGGSL